MIIDLILDRFNINGDNSGVLYNARNFYNDVLAYENDLDNHDITVAMDYLTENDVKQALCNYVVKQGYNPEICDKINRFNWLISDNCDYEPIATITADNGDPIFSEGRFYPVYSINNGNYTFKAGGKAYTFTPDVLHTFFVAF